MQQHLLPVHGDEQITQLGPGEHHHSQVAAGQGQAAAQFTGGNPLRGSGSPAAVDGPGAQGQQPVQQRRAEEAQNKGKLRIAVPDIGADRGEHLIRHHHGHGDALPIVHHRLGGADDLAAGDGQNFQIGLNALLPVDAGKGGIQAHAVIGHGDGEVHSLHRILKAGQQRDGEHQLPFGGLFSLIHGGLVGGRDLHRLGQGIADAHGGVAYVALADAAQVYLKGGGGPGGGGLGAVDGDICCVQRHGIGEPVNGSFQPEVHRGGHKAVALRGDGALQIHLCRGGFRRNRQAENPRQQQAQCKKNRKALHAAPSFP